MLTVRLPVALEKTREAESKRRLDRSASSWRTDALAPLDRSIPAIVESKIAAGEDRVAWTAKRDGIMI